MRVRGGSDRTELRDLWWNDDFLDLFGDCFARKDTRAHLGVYVRGQLSDLPEKSVEPIAVEAGVATRIKMAQTANVLAVAITGDGKVLYAQKEVKVTLGGCGG